EALADSAALAQLRARQANYLAFAEGFAPACRTDADAPGAKLYWRHTLEVDGGLRIRIVGLNTALLAADEAVFESDQGRLGLGTRQLSAAFTEPEVAPDEVVIVLSHHPLRDHWLADETDAARWIRSHAHLHLSGHVHEAASERAGSGGGTALVSIAAGAVHGEKTPRGYPARHGYSFGALAARAGTLKVCVWPRMWSDANKDFRLDVDNVPPNETYAEHDLPRVRVPAGVNAAAVPEAPASDPGHQPVPQYLDDEIRRLSLQMEKARERKRRLQDAGESTSQVDREILGLRRQLREGGQLRAGDSLGDGRFLLIESIGQGGFAHIWKATDRVRRETVAIKVLHANLAGDVLKRERFFRGARMMADLQHPAVVKVVEQNGVDGGYHYFVMEYVAGGNLRQAVLKKALTQDQFLSVILRIGEALALAHSRGIIHRDVKPANILLDTQGQPLLTDFDLVGAADTTGGTRTGAMGTFVYAAPECLDHPQEADRRADVYSLGMTTVFGLHGTDLPSQILRDPEFFISGLPCTQSLKDVLSRAISLDPGDRYQQVSEFISAVQHARNGSPAAREPLPRATSPEEPRKVRLTVHRAFFLMDGQECFFINATNLSTTREIELTHLWLQLHSHTPVLQADRQLPKRLKPDESWETWIRVDAVPEQFHERVYTLARARLSSGQIVLSEKNEGVPEEGVVPGGPIKRA
ncbi:MAG TPA: protein kinase, partial [Longimicrobiaceae bacterium]|nr:protein kinase [Longimicrobiaceae bacterium]